MEATVTRRFRDLRDGQRVYAVGEPFEGTEARVRELAAKGFVEPKGQAKRPPKATQRKGREVSG